MAEGLYCYDRGSGFPLVLLHGNGEEHGYFARQLELFSDRRVLAPDTRGHGRSPVGRGPFTLARFAGDLEGLRREKQLERLDLLGYSDGGNIALLYALQHPERVRRLMLVGANLDPSGLTLYWQLRNRLERLFCRFRDPAAPGCTARKSQLLELMLREPRISPESLQRLTMPVLVAAGQRDAVRRRHTEQIAAALPQGRLCILPGSHDLIREDPEGFHRLAADFFAE